MDCLSGIIFVPICNTVYRVISLGLPKGLIVRRTIDYVYIPDGSMVMFSGDCPESAYLNHFSRDYKSLPPIPEIIPNGVFLSNQEAAE